MSSWCEHLKNFPSAEEERSPFFQCKVSLNLTSSEKVIFALVQQKFTCRKNTQNNVQSGILAQHHERNEKKNFMTFNFLFVFSTKPTCEPEACLTAILIEISSDFIGHYKVCVRILRRWALKAKQEGSSWTALGYCALFKIFAFGFWQKCSLMGSNFKVVLKLDQL